jgi:hypothetical protein
MSDINNQPEIIGMQTKKTDVKVGEKFIYKLSGIVVVCVHVDARGLFLPDNNERRATFEFFKKNGEGIQHFDLPAPLWPKYLQKI